MHRVIGNARHLGKIRTQIVRDISKTKTKDVRIDRKRHYMTGNEYSRLSSEFRDRYESASLKPQIEANCYFVSLVNSFQFSKTSGFKVGMMRNYPQLNEKNLTHIDRNLELGIPGVLYGINVGADRSGWINHAVTVLGKDGEDYIVHDPDPYHHQKTESAYQSGANEPKDYLRRLSKREIMNVKQHVTFSFMEPNYSGVFEQAEPKAADSTYSFSSFFGRLFRKRES